MKRLDAKEKYRQERIANYDETARQLDNWKGWGEYYHRRLEQTFQFLVSPGQRVLEIGCAQGDFACVTETVGRRGDRFL